MKLFVDFISIAYLRRPESLSQFSDSLRAGRFRVRIRVEAEIFSTHPATPSPLYNGYRVIPGGKTASAWRWQPTQNQRRDLRQVHPRTGHEGPQGEQRYSSTLSLTSGLDGGGWLTPLPSCFTPGKDTQYLFYGSLVGPQGRSKLAHRISPPLKFNPWTVNPVASRYTNYDIPEEIL